ncbi:MAG: hypothetical protein GKR97_13205 [Rhizobiaceae bacterium]|nr:hypothetical protein [Rhizobiaceae bacterium]
MLKLSKFVVANAIAALIAGTLSSAFAQQTQPLWLGELKTQIYQDEGCDANYFLNLHEYTLGNDKVYEAKVQCVDGRQFDATRTGEFSLFVIRACQPVVC